VVAMLDHLREGDRFGMVLFDDQAYLAKPMNPVEKTDMEAVKGHILDLTPQGGTNMEAGYREAQALFDDFLDVDHSVYENRIIFLTDAMPNLGNLFEDSLVGMVASAAEDKVHTTFIGVGLDFNTELVEAITEVRGANYYSVHSEERFKERMDEEFEYMVTPVVFDLSLTFESRGFEIDAVYGSPEAEQATGELMNVNTLFPSKTEGGETKGGIIVLKLRQTGESAEIKLSASYKDRNEKSFSTDETFSFSAAPESAPQSGIQKGVLLARYVRLMKEWIRAERETLGDDPETGLSNWERTSVPLTVSEAYRTAFQTFLLAFTAERTAIGDDTLIREEEILETLISWNGAEQASL
jgi:Ca-activated chloride channel family protein